MSLPKTKAEADARLENLISLLNSFEGPHADDFEDEDEEEDDYDDYEDDGQPDEAQEWYDFDPNC